MLSVDRQPTQGCSQLTDKDDREPVTGEKSNTGNSSVKTGKQHRDAVSR